MRLMQFKARARSEVSCTGEATAASTAARNKEMRKRVSPNSMRIAMIGQKGIPACSGGVERHVEELSRRLVLLGHEVSVYSRFWYTKTRQREYHGVKIILLPSIHTKHLDAISHTFLATFFAIKGHYDVIHYHGVGPALLCWIPRLFARKIKVVVTFHSIDRYQQKWNCVAKRFLKLGERFAMLFANKIIAVSKTIQQYCKEEYGRDVVFIPNGFTHYGEHPDHHILGQWNLEEKKYVVIVGRLIPDKGIPYLIAAADGVPDGYKFVIIGNSPAFAKDYGEHLKRLAAHNANIIFVGFQAGFDLGCLYSHAFLTVHPSEVEGLSLAVLESFAHGTAVLASNIPANREVISEEEFLFINQDVKDLVKKLNFLFAHPEKVRDEAFLKQQLVEEHYSWDHIAQETERVY